MAIFFGIVLIVVGIIMINDWGGPIGPIFFIAGIIVLIIGLHKFIKKQEKNDNNSHSATAKPQPARPSTSQRAQGSNGSNYGQDKAEIIRTANGYKVNLKLRNVDDGKALIFNVYLAYVFNLFGQIKHLPICTTNPKYWSDSKFEFLFTKVGTRNELNNFSLEIKANELVRPVKFGAISNSGIRSKYVAFITLQEKNFRTNIIEKFEELNFTIEKCLEDEEQTFIYGIKRFIELGFIISKVDGHYTSKERAIITSFIETNAVTSEHNNLRNYLRNLESKMVRSFDTLIFEVKNSIGAVQLITKGMELLVNLSVSDGEIEAKEEVFLKKFATAFGFSDNDYKNLITKYVLKNTDFTLSLQLFGISDDMSTMEKKRLLNKAYVEWNRKIISSNSEMRQRAKMVIEFISHERLKL